MCVWVEEEEGQGVWVTVGGARCGCVGVRCVWGWEGVCGVWEWEEGRVGRWWRRRRSHKGGGKEVREERGREREGYVGFSVQSRKCSRSFSAFRVKHPLRTEPLPGEILEFVGS